MRNRALWHGVEGPLSWLALTRAVLDLARSLTNDNELCDLTQSMGRCSDPKMACRRWKTRGVQRADA
jgi:hypothetical protein